MSDYLINARPIIGGYSCPPIIGQLLHIICTHYIMFKCKLSGWGVRKGQKMTPGSPLSATFVARILFILWTTRHTRANTRKVSDHCCWRLTWWSHRLGLIYIQSSFPIPPIPDWRKSSNQFFNCQHVSQCWKTVKNKLNLTSQWNNFFGQTYSRILGWNSAHDSNWS